MPTEKAWRPIEHPSSAPGYFVDVRKVQYLWPIGRETFDDINAMRAMAGMEPLVWPGKA